MNCPICTNEVILGEQVTEIDYWDYGFSMPDYCEFCGWSGMLTPEDCEFVVECWKNQWEWV